MSGPSNPSKRAKSAASKPTASKAAAHSPQPPGPKASRKVRRRRVRFLPLFALSVVVISGGLAWHSQEDLLNRVRMRIAGPVIAPIVSTSSVAAGACLERGPACPPGLQLRRKSRTKLPIPGLSVYTSVKLGRSPELCLFLPHENEATAYSVALDMAHRRPIEVLRVEQVGKRNITFARSTIDPNRIFTAPGRKASLKKLNRSAVSAKIGGQAAGFAAQVTEAVTGCVRSARSKVLIALHNNTDDSYSARSYAKGGSEEKAAAQVYINPKQDPDDFIFTTDPKFFGEFKARNINVVLQASEPPDDGSLSVLFSDTKYINVEAEHGHFNQQVKMLAIVAGIVSGTEAKE